MAPQIQAPRGTRDLLPEEARAWNRLEHLARDLSDRYAFDRLETPLFERVELFARGLGESSDAVEKEMFRVSGAAGSDEERAEWALRPEPTAGIMRAYIEHGMHVRPGPQRLWLIGPMFRYDRPQAGRYRQFTQWDVEIINDPGPMVDAELVELAHRFFREAGIPGVVAHLNSIGDTACRPRYRQVLVEYFAAHEDQLSDDSRRRLRVNPLRVLDDKELDPQLAAGAPRGVDHLCEPCAEHFAEVCTLLDQMGQPYVLDHRLVRGLDYYTRTTFEFFVSGREGQQQALAGGGRYDGLAELLGGRPTPGIGFGLGIDRSALALEEAGSEQPDATPLVVIVSANPDAFEARLQVASVMRETRPGLRIRVDGSSRKLGRQLESAGKLGALVAVIVGDELLRGSVILRDLSRGEQREVPLEKVADAVLAAARTATTPG
ncbi:MAG TPA: histidine--tRNA ligase [Candidatus Limnocylindrales bacterium]|nr:histidine--tRNA ligase [Candidatus Limnocylindrales bacterium]